MDSEKDVSNSDDYLETALQIFDFCGADSNGTLRVETLMEKISPIVKSNKCEPDLRTLLDPDLTNPRISVTMLSNTLKKYSENQKNKVDLEESFNLRSGPVPQDSDSGISSDGFQLLEELQCELREKDRLATQLRTQLNLSDQQHEEAVSSLVAERDALRAQLIMLREENSSLLPIRAEYEEMCDKFSASDAALGDAQRALDAARRRALHAQALLAGLEGDKQILQELLNKSKDECHRINDMYASRQAALIEQNEALKTECAELAARLQDQEEVVQTLAKDKVRIEMELKDQLNKSTIQSRLDRSIEVSYTEEQLVSLLDSLNSDSRYTQDLTLDDVSFLQYHEDPGRPTNMSLFDEIRLSIGNVPRFKDIEAFTENSTVANDYFGSSKDFVDFGFKKREKGECNGCDKRRCTNLQNFKTPSGPEDVTQRTRDTGNNNEIKWPECETSDVATQCTAEDFNEENVKNSEHKKVTHSEVKAFCDAVTQWENKYSMLKNAGTQCAVTDTELKIVTQSRAKELCDAVTQWENKDSGLKDAGTQCAVTDSELETVTHSEAKKHSDAVTQWENEDFEHKDMGTQCGDIDSVLKKVTHWENKNSGLVDDHMPVIIRGPKLKDVQTRWGTKDFGPKHIESHYRTKDILNQKTIAPQEIKPQICQDNIQSETNNNNLETKCQVCICTECERNKEYATKLESDLTHSRSLVKELHFKMDGYVGNLRILKQTVDEEHQANNALKANIKTLKVKLVLLEKACKQQKEELDGLFRDTTSTVYQACPEVSSVWTQADEACADCAARALVPKKTLRNKLWDGFTSVFSILALLCFAGAICFLYQVSHYHFASKRCGERLALPWSWLRVADVLEAVFRVEIIGEVPM